MGDMDCGTRGTVQDTVLVIHSETTPQYEGLLEIGRREPLPAITGGKFDATESCIVGTGPSTQTDLGEDQADTKPDPGPKMQGRSPRCLGKKSSLS